MAGVRVTIEGRDLTLTNLDKEFYPARGFTKAAVVDYYARIAPVMVPHLADRAATLVRYPDGVEGFSFFEKRCPPGAPDWTRTGGPQRSLVIDEAATLVWVANLAAIELHTHQHVLSEPGRPLSVVFDLDPGPPAGIRDCARVALDLQALLDRMDLTAVVKTSGSKGLHLAVPIRGAVRTDEETKAFALALGQILAGARPDAVTVTMAKKERPGKVFVDWSQNDVNKTTVAAYSLRARPSPTVSTPVTWDEVADTAQASDDDPLQFEAPDVLTRVDAVGDLYGPNLVLEQDLPRLT